MCVCVCVCVCVHCIYMNELPSLFVLCVPLLYGYLSPIMKSDMLDIDIDSVDVNSNILA